MPLSLLSEYPFFSHNPTLRGALPPGLAGRGGQGSLVDKTQRLGRRRRKH